MFRSLINSILSLVIPLLQRIAWVVKPCFSLVRFSKFSYCLKNFNYLKLVCVKPTLKSSKKKGVVFLQVRFYAVPPKGSPFDKNYKIKVSDQVFNRNKNKGLVNNFEFYKSRFNFKKPLYTTEDFRFVSFNSFLLWLPFFIFIIFFFIFWICAVPINIFGLFLMPFIIFYTYIFLGASILGILIGPLLFILTWILPNYIGLITIYAKILILVGFLKMFYLFFRFCFYRFLLLIRRFVLAHKVFFKKTWQDFVNIVKQVRKPFVVDVLSDLARWFAHIIVIISILFAWALIKIGDLYFTWVPFFFYKVKNIFVRLWFAFFFFFQVFVLRNFLKFFLLQKLPEKVYTAVERKVKLYEGFAFCWFYLKAVRSYDKKLKKYNSILQLNLLKKSKERTFLLRFKKLAVEKHVYLQKLRRNFLGRESILVSHSLLASKNEVVSSLSSRDFFSDRLVHWVPLKTLIRKRRLNAVKIKGGDLDTKASEVKLKSLSMIVFGVDADLYEIFKDRFSEGARNPVIAQKIDDLLVNKERVRKEISLPPKCCFSRYEEYRQPLFFKKISEFLGDGVAVNVKKNKKKRLKRRQFGK